MSSWRSGTVALAMRRESTIAVAGCMLWLVKLKLQYLRMIHTGTGVDELIKAISERERSCLPHVQRLPNTWLSLNLTSCSTSPFSRWSLSLVSTTITITDRYTHVSAGCLTRRGDPVVKQEEADQEPERHRRTPMPELEHSSLVGPPRIHDQRRAVGEHHDVARRADLCSRSALFTASTILAV